MIEDDLPSDPAQALQNIVELAIHIQRPDNFRTPSISEDINQMRGLAKQIEIIARNALGWECATSV
jgi:hypothetical protein